MYIHTISSARTRHSLGVTEPYTKSTKLSSASHALRANAFTVARNQFILNSHCSVVMTVLELAVPAGAPVLHRKGVSLIYQAGANGKIVIRLTVTRSRKDVDCCRCHYSDICRKLE